jgi:hypothetical protein
VRLELVHLELVGIVGPFLISFLMARTKKVDSFEEGLLKGVAGPGLKPGITCVN